jgi:hypothetical protein
VKFLLGIERRCPIIVVISKFTHLLTTSILFTEIAENQDTGPTQAKIPE